VHAKLLAVLSKIPDLMVARHWQDTSKTPARHQQDIGKTPARHQQDTSKTPSNTPKQHTGKTPHHAKESQCQGQRQIPTMVTCYCEYFPLSVNIWCQSKVT